MIKQFLAGFLTAVVSIASVAQQKNEKKDDSKDLIRMGANMVYLYYGSSVAGTVYKDLADNGAAGLTFKNTGPYGVVYEHLLTNVIGLGAEFGYSQLKMSFTTTGYNQNTFQDQTYNSYWKFTTAWAMARINLHFIHKERVDAYVLISAGYRKSSYTFTSEDEDYAGKTTFDGLSPVWLKPGFGLRYFFTKHVGFNIEVAAGTPVFCGGLGFKF